METISQDVGGCGCFQVCHIFCVQLIRFINVWAFYLMVFGNYEPPWKCVKNVHVAHNNTKMDRNYSHAYFYEKPDDNDFEKLFTSSAIQSSAHFALSGSNTTRNNFTSLYFQGTCSRLPYCDEIVFDPTSVTLVTEFGLICDQAFVPSTLLAIQMLGMLFGTFLGGQMGELLGRKLIIYTCLAVMSVAISLAAWSTSWQMYAILNFFIGLGGGGIAVLHLTYAMEFLTPKWRGRFGALPTWNISLVIFAFIIIGLKNWRHIHIFSGGVAISFLLGAFWAPESMRWLHVHGKEAEVKKVIKKIMKYNRHPNDVSQVMNKLIEANTEETVTDRRFTYLDLFRTSRIRAFTIKGTFILFACLMSYYTLGFSVKSFSGNYYTNLIISCSSEIPLILLIGPCVNKLGRKITASIFLSLSTVCTTICVIAYYVTTQSTAGSIIKYSAILAKGFANVAWTAVQILTIELFPTVVRSLAIGLMNTAARIGGIIASTLIPRDQESVSVCYIVLSGVLLLASIIVLTLPETKGKPLQDTIVVTKDVEENVE